MKALRLVFGSIIVYLSVATLHACSASPPNLTAGTSGTGGSGGRESTAATAGHGGAIVSGPGAGGFTSSVSGEVASTSGDIFDSGIFDALTDPVDSASADPTSGSRLKAYYQTSDDGGKAYLHGSWYDSQRNEDCSFTIASDGARRCLPFAYAYQIASYLDSGCTQPLAPESSNGCVPLYVYAISTVAQACGYTYRYALYDVFGTIAVSTVYSKSTGTCKATAVNPSTVFHLVGPEIPPAAFVGGSYQHD